MDRIHSAQTLDESFSLSPGFSLADSAARSFGVYQDPEQYSEVVWRFAPAAAGRAAEFCFHPKQIAEPQDDGSLIVRFHPSGWLEMAWHLYPCDRTSTRLNSSHECASLMTSSA